MPFIRTCALHKIRAAPLWNLYPAPILAPKIFLRLFPLLKFVPYIWAGARELHSEGAELRQLAHGCRTNWNVNWRCSLTKPLFSEVQERIWGKNTELNHFLNVSELDQAVSLLK